MLDVWPEEEVDLKRKKDKDQKQLYYFALPLD